MKGGYVNNSQINFTYLLAGIVLNLTTSLKFILYFFFRVVSGNKFEPMTIPNSDRITIKFLKYNDDRYRGFSCTVCKVIPPTLAPGQTAPPPEPEPEPVIAPQKGQVKYEQHKLIIESFRLQKMQKSIFNSPTIVIFIIISIFEKNCKKKNLNGTYTFNYNFQ